MLTMVYSEEETINMFGQEHLDDYGVEIPSEIVLEFKKTYENLLRISAELEKYRGSNENVYR
jgi:hypothetical protein